MVALALEWSRDVAERRPADERPAHRREAAPRGLPAAVGVAQLWAGDAHSLVKVVDLSSGAIVATVSTGASNRADELAYDPQDHLILIANDADDPRAVIDWLLDRSSRRRPG